MNGIYIMNVVILKININTGHVNLSYDQMLQQSKNVHFVFRAIIIHNFLPMIIIITLFFLILLSHARQCSEHFHF